MAKRARQNDGLSDYRRKRDFTRTDEPPGGTTDRSDTGRLYCLQKHHARQLHYDLRLELDGVLRSWAVPRGPSLDPAAKPLAVHTEDHPIEYGGFEGIIPKGAYGGGTVMLWDVGHWEPIGDPHEGLDKGDFKFRLHGTKLRGEFVLARMKTPEDRAKGTTGRNWLLIKKRDADARTEERYDILIEEPDSVLTNRSIAQIAADHDVVWEGGLGGRAVQTDDEPATTAAKTTINPLDPSGCTGAKRAPQPEALRPQLATSVPDAPIGDTWLHEIKYDGYRILSAIERGLVRLRTRNGHDWTDRMPPVARALERLPIRRAIFDGEVVILDERGVADFGALQAALGGRRAAGPIRTNAPFVYLVFDLLHLNGWDLTATPLIERKALLQRVLEAGAGAAPTVRFSDHIVGNGPLVASEARASGVEGIISKRASSRYVQRRSDSWLKIKFPSREEFVIGGYKDPEGARTGFGSLVIGRHDRDGRLICNGRVGTGFDESALVSLKSRLDEIATDACPFANPPTGVDAIGVHWVRPELVCEVSYTEITGEGMIRHPVFVALREDKPVADVVIDEPPPPPDDPEPAPRATGTRPAVIRAPRTPDDDQINGVRLSNPNRIVYPDERLTKRDVALYCVNVARRMIPHVIDRPISIVRCPKGVHHEHFFQRHPAEGMPPEVGSIEVTTRDGPEAHLMIHDLAGMLSLVQFGTLEVHVWGCRADRLDRPDQMVFDLDPDESVPKPHVVDAALFIRDLLADLGLSSVVKTSGGKGFHIGVPLVRRVSWGDVREFSRAVAERAASLAPELFTASMAKRLRTGRIFIDYLRNVEGATFVAPYSMRARPGATVSLPIRWAQLERSTRGDTFGIRSIPEDPDDPWILDEGPQTLSAAIRRRLS